ncbi:hypothetical protein niasHS_000545 [Heterodera schachtii]|uniref:Uncharacterized protein n=1 Tax=Heterodera schachtii TaxID=97005 RepID=A0ABD2K4Z2_HETSC
MHHGKGRLCNCPRWEKVLYKRQPFPDNYTDEALFLDQLKTNVGLVPFTFSSAICAACTVMAHFDLVVLFLCCFELVHSDVFGPFALFCFCSFASSAILLAHFALLRSSDLFQISSSDFVEYFRTFVTIFAFGYAFTPVIRTLTTSISTDTIYACAILLFFASLFVHDYGINVPLFRQFAFVGKSLPRRLRFSDFSSPIRPCGLSSARTFALSLLFLASAEKRPFCALAPSVAPLFRAVLRPFSLRPLSFGWSPIRLYVSSSPFVRRPFLSVAFHSNAKPKKHNPWPMGRSNAPRID